MKEGLIEAILSSTPLDDERSAMHLLRDPSRFDRAERLLRDMCGGCIQGQLNRYARIVTDAQEAAAVPGVSALCELLWALRGLRQLALGEPCREALL